MEEICRLCCSTKYVNNNIFDEENALYLKMSLYLPIKIFKNDRLPQKVCDKCSCKVNDFYQFCNETIEVQNRLRSILFTVRLEQDESFDLTRIKNNASPPASTLCERSTQTDDGPPVDANDFANNIKEEQVASPAVVKQEDDTIDYDNTVDQYSDNSEDISLIALKKRKKKKQVNGVAKKSKKKKTKLNDWELIMNALPEGTALSLVDKANIPELLQELPQDTVTKSPVTVEVKVKNEANLSDTLHCCICFTQCEGRTEMLQHYRQHADDVPLIEQPIPPQPLGPGVKRCMRCRKEVQPEQWAAHWQRHWAHDRRPYRCALCEKAYHDHREILKHGLTHKYDVLGGGEVLAVEAVPVRRVSGAVRVHAVPAGAPRTRTPRGRGAPARAALRDLRTRLRAHQLAAPTPARALRRAEPPLQRVREGALLTRAPQVPHPHPHRIQAQRLQDLRQGVREEVQPDAARARALRGEAARLLALRESLQPALHARHTRKVPQRGASVRVCAVRPRVRRQGPALDAPQDHLHIVRARHRRPAPSRPAAAPHLYSSSPDQNGASRALGGRRAAGGGGGARGTHAHTHTHTRLYV